MRRQRAQPYLPQNNLVCDETDACGSSKSETENDKQSASPASSIDRSAMEGIVSEHRPEEECSGMSAAFPSSISEINNNEQSAALMAAYGGPSLTSDIQQPRTSPSSLTSIHKGRDARECPPISSLLDNDYLATHSIGLAGEQDSHLLASIRSIIVDEADSVGVGVAQAYSGNTARGLPPIHFHCVRNEFVPHDATAMKKASDAIEVLAGENATHLVNLYFKHVDSWNFVVSKTRFLGMYAKDRMSIPASLRGAIYGLGAMFGQYDPESRGVLSKDVAALFQQAHYSLHHESHAPNVWTLQATYLLMHQRPASTSTMETPRTWILSAQAVATAQMIGLHRDPELWNIDAYEKRLRKKMWWTVFYGDVWSSICHGNPLHIVKGSFTTSMVTFDELAMDEDPDDEISESWCPSLALQSTVRSARFVEAVKLSQLLHELLHCF